MANTSIDGLISGLNTTDIITQLMQLERQPQDRLRSQRSALDTTTSAYQGLNARFDALLQAASKLQDDTGWLAMRATTSDESRLQAVAAPHALDGDLVITVEQLATAHTLVSERAVSGLGAVVATGPLSFTVGGQPQQPIDVGDGTLASVVGAINAADIGVDAVAVQVAPSTYRLQLTASTTGASGAFSVDPAPLAALAEPAEVPADADAFDIVATGTDATLRLGGPTGYTVSSSSNTFRDLLPGVDLTARRADVGTSVTVQIRQDDDAIVGRIRAVVTAVNDALGSIATSTAFDPVSGRRGALIGNGLVRQLQQELYSALRIDQPGRSLGDVGLRLGAGGLQVDEDALRNALGVDRSAVADAFTGTSTPTGDDGLAVRLVDVADRASHPRTGSISLAISSTGQRAVDFDARIAAWDVRLVSRESLLRRQFSGLESALRQLQNQSTWLAGQLSGLPTWGS